MHPLLNGEKEKMQMHEIHPLLNGEKEKMQMHEIDQACGLEGHGNQG